MARVQSAHAYPGTSKIFASNNTAGNLLIAIGNYSYSGSAPSPVFSVDQGNVINNIASFNSVPNAGSGVGIVVAYVMNCAGGVKATFTLGTLGTSTDQSVTIIEYSGYATSSVLGMTPSATTAGASNTTTPTSGSFTPSGAGNLLIAIIGNESTTITSTTAGTGYTIVQSDTSHADAQQENLSSSSGAQTASFTVAPTNNKWCMYVVEFKAASAAPAVNIGSWWQQPQAPVFEANQIVGY